MSFNFPPNAKRPKILRALLPVNQPQLYLRHAGGVSSLDYLQTPSSILRLLGATAKIKYSKTQSSFKKQTLVKLFG